MFGTSSAIVWDTYPRPESLIAVKKKSNKKVRKNTVVPGKDYLESFEHYYDTKINEVVDSSKVPASEDDELLPTIFYEDGSYRVRMPENGEKFEPQELRQLISAKRIKVIPHGSDAYLVIDLDGDQKMVNVKGSIILNAINNSGDIVGGTCIFVPAHMMP